MCTKHAGSAFNALVQLKCPHCRRGKMFTHSAFNLKKFQKMHSHCRVCGQNFEPETGLYWGAMYISYSFTVAICVTMGIAINVLFDDPDVNVYIIAIIGTILLLSPFLFRYSRGMMLHQLGNVRYDPSWKNRTSGKQ